MSWVTKSGERRYLHGIISNAKNAGVRKIWKPATLSHFLRGERQLQIKDIYGIVIIQLLFSGALPGVHWLGVLPMGEIRVPCKTADSLPYICITCKASDFLPVESKEKKYITEIWLKIGGLPEVQYA
jgi:hypothetical protein